MEERLFGLLFIPFAIAFYFVWNAAQKGIFILLRWELKRETPHITEFEALSKPETIEDAKRLLMHSREDDYGMCFRRMLFIQFLLVFLIGTGIAGLAGLHFHEMSTFWVSMVGVVIMSFPFYMTYHSYNKTSERILDGSYFYGKREPDEEILRMMTNYVDDYNDFERAMGRVPAEPGTLPEDSWKSAWLRRKRPSE